MESPVEKPLASVLNSYRMPMHWTSTKNAGLSSLSSKNPIPQVFRASSPSILPSSSANPSMRLSPPSVKQSSSSSSSSSSSCRTGEPPLSQQSLSLSR